MYIENITDVGTVTMRRDNTRRKIVFVLIDGVGDVSIPSLGGKSPLEVSTCPVLDSIASAFVLRLLIIFKYLVHI